MGAGLNQKGMQWLILVAIALGSHLLTKHHYQTETTMEKNNKGRITGIGGIFFKTEDPAKLREWYSENMGFNTNQYGTVFEFGKLYDNNEKGFLQWGTFAKKSNYFEGEWMINYRVENLEALLADMREKGVEIVDEVETYDYGKFVHIRDLEGNKIELWEPVDSVFAKFDDGTGVTR